MSKPKPPMVESAASATGPAPAATLKRLSPAAERALAEAAARRVERDKQAAAQPAEVKGRSGPDPVRYGDWEVKGIASDF